MALIALEEYKLNSADLCRRSSELGAGALGKREVLVGMCPN